MKQEKITFFILLSLLIVVFFSILLKESNLFKPVKTLCLGDSITKATYLVSNGGYCVLINQSLELNTEKFAVGGFTVEDLVRNVNNVTNKGFTQSLVMIGTNNRGSSDGFKSNLTYLVKVLKEDGQKVILLTIPPVDSTGVEKINQYVQEVANEQRVDLIDVNLAFNRVYTQTYFADKYHPNDAGHVLIANKIIEELR